MLSVVNDDDADAAAPPPTLAAVAATTVSGDATTVAADARSRWIVCEDGTEYIERFARFLDGEFRFEAAPDAAALDALLDAGPAAGVILDLDFRRTPPERLVDEEGRTQEAPPEAVRRRLSESQGLLILRRLRAAGRAVPVLLFADLDDADQAAYLEQTLAPLEVVPGREGLVQTAARMRRR